MCKNSRRYAIFLYKGEDEVRLSREQREGIMSKFGVETLHSFSRISTYWNMPWEYYLVYLKKIPRNFSNIYSHWGLISHDLIQDYYDGKYPYEKMSELLEEHIIDWRTNHSHLKFMNKKIEDGYIENLRDYFKTTETIPYDIKNETAVCIHFPVEGDEEDIVFIGYIDSEYVDDDGVLNIVDYKTSSISGFTGKKLKEKARQLSLYAIGINQFRGIPFDKIRLRFDMMKYYEVRYLQKNGKTAKSKKERSKWVEGVLKKLQKELAALDYDPIEVDDLLEMSVLNNSIKNLPQEVQDKFSLHNCYIDVTITKDEAKELEKLMRDTVAEIREKEKGDWEIEFPEPKIDYSNKFYLEQLAPHLLKYHQRFQEEQKMLKPEVEVEDDDLLAMFK